MLNFLETHSYEWSFNDPKLQSSWSDVCRQYGILYLTSGTWRKHDKNKLVFGKDIVLNDSKVAGLVNRISKLNQTVQETALSKVDSINDTQQF